MTPEQFLRGLKEQIRPQADIEARIKRSVQARIAGESPLFAELKASITPKKVLQKNVWQRVSSRIELPQATAFTRIRISLLPSPELKEHIKRKVLESLEPVHAAASGLQTLKWSAAFVMVAMMVRLSPMLFVASPTVAESEAVLIPTRGEVSVSIGGLWQTVDREMALEPGMLLRTHDGEASIILHDDGVVRLDKETSIRLEDISNRLEPASEVLPSLTLLTGRIWMQGLVPSQLRGITVATTYGQVTVNEGSLSIAEDEYVDIEVYDRSATVQQRGQQTYLASGERTELAENGALLVKKIPAKWYQYTWASQNLDRDAVHRHDIAQLQHERRIAQAGILPTSPLYPVKRFAELMDVWMTFDNKTRVEKRLQVAETRLNEAAALIYNGEKADEPLEEYSAMLEYIADGKTYGSLSEFLVQHALAESTSQISAALPGDESYVIKKTVLEASAKLPGGIVREEAARGSLLLDGLTAMVKATESGNTEMVRSVWSDLQPYVRSLDDRSVALTPAMHKEAKTLLSFLATSLQVASNRGAKIDPELLDDLAAYLPAPKDTGTVVLSEEEIMQIVMKIREKIFLYDMTQSRINQFVAELRALNGHPDEGRILRRLAQTLPDGPERFPERVYKEIVKLRWENASTDTL